eukprot:Tbor_TRINITY_DN2417_c0_g1::TRINITY_DN2417_c0_g1_i1::g.2623::m.2623
MTNECGYSPRDEFDEFDESDEWEAANAAFYEDARTRDENRPQIDSVVWIECIEHIESEEDMNSFLESFIRVSPSKIHGCLGALFSFFNPEFEVESRAYKSRDFLLSLQPIELSYQKMLHKRIIFRIYRFLEDIPDYQEDPSLFGTHWEELGFQGADPATDLRTTGILGLLHILYLIDEAPCFCKVLYSTSKSITHDFPFVLVCFNFSVIAIECLQQRGLHKFIRKAERDEINSNQPSFTVVGDFYTGCLFFFLKEWKSVNFRTISDFGCVKATVAKVALSNPKMMLDYSYDARNVSNVADIKFRTDEDDPEFSCIVMSS